MTDPHSPAPSPLTRRALLRRAGAGLLGYSRENREAMYRLFSQVTVVSAATTKPAAPADSEQVRRIMEKFEGRGVARGRVLAGSSCVTRRRKTRRMLGSVSFVESWLCDFPFTSGAQSKLRSSVDARWDKSIGRRGGKRLAVPSGKEATILRSFDHKNAILTDPTGPHL